MLGRLLVGRLLVGRLLVGRLLVGRLLVSLAVLAVSSGFPASIGAQDEEGTSLAAPVPSTAPPEAALPEVPANSPELESARRGHPEQGAGESFAAWLDVGIFSGPYAGGDFTLIGTEFGVRMGIERIARMTVDWGFAYAMAHVVGSVPRPTMPTMPLAYDGTTERIEGRNPVIAFDVNPWLGTNTRLSVGLALAIPSAAIQTFGDANQAGPGTPEEAVVFVASRTTHDVWLATNGGWNAWRYPPERLGVALPLSLAIDAGAVEVNLEGALGVSVPVLGGSGIVDGIAQAAIELYGTPIVFGEGRALVLGVRASVAGYHLGAATSAAQPAFEPWLRVDLRPVFLSVRGIVNVGDPFGVGTANGVWSLHVGGGVAVD